MSSQFQNLSKFDFDCEQAGSFKACLIHIGADSDSINPIEWDKCLALKDDTKKYDDCVYHGMSDVIECLDYYCRADPTHSVFVLRDIQDEYRSANRVVDRTTIKVRVEKRAVEGEIPVEEKPAEEQIPVEENPVEEIPVEEIPVEEIPVEEIPVEETPAEEIPVEEEQPVEETPVEETPVEEIPVEEIPVEEIPVEEKPTEEQIPVEEAPVEETPAEEQIPVEEEQPAEEQNPVEEEQPVEEQPTEEQNPEASANEDPVNEDPVNEDQVGPMNCEAPTEYDQCINKFQNLDPRIWKKCEIEKPDVNKYDECVYNGYSEIIECLDTYCKNDATEMSKNYKKYREYYKIEDNNNNETSGAITKKVSKFFVGFLLISSLLMNYL